MIATIPSLLFHPFSLMGKAPVWRQLHPPDAPQHTMRLIVFHVHSHHYKKRSAGSDGKTLLCLDGVVAR